MVIKTSKELSKSTKIFFLLLFTILLFLLIKIIRGHFLPEPGDGAWFQFGFLLIVLGSFFLEPHFSKPTDAITNSIAVIVTLLSVVDRRDFVLWTAMFVLSVTLLVLSILSLALAQPELNTKSLRYRISRIAYDISTTLGRGMVLFSVIFIVSAASYFSTASREFMYLVFFWGFIIIVKPTGLANLVDSIFQSVKGRSAEVIGNTIGIIQPNMVLVRMLKIVRDIAPLKPVIVHIGELEKEGQVGLVLGDYILADEKWVRILLIESKIILGPKTSNENMSAIVYQKGNVSLIKEDNLSDSIKDSFLWKNKSKIVGFVQENTNIGKLNFEVFRESEEKVEEGDLLLINVQGKEVYYQIINGITESEELQKKNRTGFIRGVAIQLGTWNEEASGFERFGWVPRINSVVYLVKEDEYVEYTRRANESVMGYIPKSRFPVIYDVEKLIKYHAAILGITGCGKSWLAYTLIRENIAMGTKTICIDFTGDYKTDLSSLSPAVIISDEDVALINTKLEEADNIRQSARGSINQAYRVKMGEIQTLIDEAVISYMDSKMNVAIFELPEISVTGNILEFTQMFLQSVFNYAKDNRGRKKICIVLEEAHTVIPEPQTFTGVWGDYGESKQIVGKISQIALQGRKYNIGFIVIAQRTANVTKTVLNQCNSIIAFNAFDDTGMKFLENYLGEDMVRVIPNLKDYQAVTAGKAFKSKRPLIVQIPIRDVAIPEESGERRITGEERESA
jgi:hypothetical protein